MGADESQIMGQVIQKTNSELILFFVLVALVLVVVIVPLYMAMSKDRKERRAADAARDAAENEASNMRQDKYIERERQIIQVITANTEVMAGLKATMETIGASTNSSLARIHSRLDDIVHEVTEISAEVAGVGKTQDQMVGNQKVMSDGVNKILLLVDSLPHNSNFGHGGLEKIS